MNRCSGPRLSLTAERDEALLKEYEEIIRKYGETAKYIPKSILYEEAARKFFITSGAAGIIIQKQLRKKTQ